MSYNLYEWIVEQKNNKLLFDLNLNVYWFILVKLFIWLILIIYRLSSLSSIEINELFIK